jgi:hypothetical protein
MTLASPFAWVLLVQTCLLELGLFIGAVQHLLCQRPWWARRFTVACEPLHQGGEWLYLCRTTPGAGRSFPWEWRLDPRQATTFPWWHLEAHLWALQAGTSRGCATWRQWL